MICDLSARAHPTDGRLLACYRMHYYDMTSLCKLNVEQVLQKGVAELPCKLVVTLSTQEKWAAPSAPALLEGQLLVVFSTRYAR